MVEKGRRQKHVSEARLAAETGPMAWHRNIGSEHEALEPPNTLNSRQLNAGHIRPLDTICGQISVIFDAARPPVFNELSL
ncbi:unnamed protein product [Caenorhabditis auriculariae]|uniref:Uncharacterized protein n=1 Tax=Caenorhabditis auriculariae TaxID=2777116 RepID=A0A8S1GY20_9PELO|nr:unnamed protein product [Caenorhabditis auriculariae]